MEIYTSFMILHLYKSCDVYCNDLFQIAAVATLPFDVVKTHRQIQLGEAEMLKGMSLKRSKGKDTRMHLCE